VKLATRAAVRTPRVDDETRDVDAPRDGLSLRKDTSAAGSLIGSERDVAVFLGRVAVALVGAEFQRANQPGPSLVRFDDGIHVTA
jgi:hypothetical protein